MKRTISVEEALFTATRALPSSEREAYLQRACANDAALRRHVLSLLQSFDAAAGFISGERDESFGELAGQQIGNYRLIREIGEGGGGTVYLAEQIAPIKRLVAFKVIKLGMDTKAVVARFEAERQALAMMDHPNIAKVFEAGATPSGRPYFVMELVQGIRITDYCDQCALTIEERLELLTQVCAAIQHAHVKDIVHRDIKPSNILVTLHEGQPIVKVIDFGIAKAMQGRLTDETIYTAFDQFVGTPAYVSPEQTDPIAPQIDTRSDIYSLGVLLYELLTGCTPFDSEDLIKEGIDSMRRRIREVEPRTPSHRIRTLDETQATLTGTRRRQSSPVLIKQLEGDLDWVVMRCLEKDRTRRYQSASELAADIRRFLQNEPVLARPPSALYSVRKLARRHRALFASAAAIVFVLLGASIVSTWLAIRASNAERLAQATINFLQNDVLAYASPSREPDRDLKLRTVLDRAAQNIEGRFTRAPAVEISVRDTLGTTYLALGEFTTAQAQLERALALGKSELGSRNTTTLKLMHHLVQVLHRQAKYPEAEALARETIELLEQTLGADAPETLAARVTLGTIISGMGKYAEAVVLQTETSQKLERVVGIQDERTLVAMDELARALIEDLRSADAEDVLVPAVEAARRHLGAEHPLTIRLTDTLAVSYTNQSKHAQAEQLLLPLVELHRRIEGPEHPRTIEAMTNLSLLIGQQGKFQEAIALDQQIFEISRRVNGLEHPDTLSAMHNIAFDYYALGQYEEAARLHEELLAICQRFPGPEHPKTLLVMRQLAGVYRLQKRYDEARAMFEKVAEIGTRVQGPDSKDALASLRFIADIHLDQGRFAEAEAILTPLLKKIAPEDNNWVWELARADLGYALTGLGRYAEAEPLLLQGYEGLMQRMDRIPTTQRWAVAAARSWILTLYSEWNKPDKVREWEQRLATDAYAQIMAKAGP